MRSNPRHPESHKGGLIDEYRQTIRVKQIYWHPQSGLTLAGHAHFYDALGVVFLGSIVVAAYQCR